MSALSSYKSQIHLMRQIHEASYYISKAEELGHPHLWNSYTPILEFFGHFKSAVNSYAKCFVSAGKGRQKLEASSILNLTPRAWINTKKSWICAIPTLPIMTKTSSRR